MLTMNVYKIKKILIQKQTNELDCDISEKKNVDFIMFKTAVLLVIRRINRDNYGNLTTAVCVDLCALLMTL